MSDTDSVQEYYRMKHLCGCGCFHHCGTECRTDDCECQECNCNDCLDKKT